MPLANCPDCGRLISLKFPLHWCEPTRNFLRKQDLYKTGWYGIPGKDNPRAKVHVVKSGIPMCGSKLRKDQEFQWCADGIQKSYVECRNCLRIIEKLECAV